MQSVRTLSGKAVPPERDGRTADAQSTGNLTVGRSWFGAGQNDTGAMARLWPVLCCRVYASRRWRSSADKLSGVA